MAAQILPTTLVEDVASQIVIEAHPGLLEDRPKAFDAFTRATAVLIQPQLETLVQAYRNACSTPCGRAAAQIFLTNLLEAEG
ncbi:MAG: hypothetical protein WC023_07970 [Rhodocyclaceae bacterium]